MLAKDQGISPWASPWALHSDSLAVPKILFKNGMGLCQNLGFWHSFFFLSTETLMMCKNVKFQFFTKYSILRV